MKAELFALAAMVPLIAGTSPSPAAASGQSLIVPMCDGTSITIPLGSEEGDDNNGPCHPQACHAAPCRKQLGSKKFDPSQRPVDPPLR